MSFHFVEDKKKAFYCIFSAFQCVELHINVWHPYVSCFMHSFLFILDSIRQMRITLIFIVWKTDSFKSSLVLLIRFASAWVLIVCVCVCHINCLFCNNSVFFFAMELYVITTDLVLRFDMYKYRMAYRKIVINGVSIKQWLRMVKKSCQAKKIKSNQNTMSYTKLCYDLS